MKTYNKPAISRLTARFDKELKIILMNDLKMVKKAKDQFLNNINNERLSVA